MFMFSIFTIIYVTTHFVSCFYPSPKYGLHETMRLTRNFMAIREILGKFPSLFYKIKSPSLRSGDYAIL